MELYILEAMKYFTVEDWSKLDGSEQMKYGQILYIYYACIHLGISVVVPDFMTKMRIDQNEIQKDNIIYKCKYCVLTFILKKDNDKHMKICRRRFDFIKKKKHACKECNYSTNDLVRLKLHHLIHNKEKKYVCDFCAKAFALKSNLQVHVNVIHLKKGKEIKCGKCAYVTNRQSSLSTHMKSHLRKEFICEICKKSVRDLKMHLLRHKKREEPHICSKCEKVFSTSRQLTNHMNAIHLKNDQFQCDKCKYSTSVELDFKVHSISHLNKKFFKCNHCEYATSDKSNFKRHNLIHLDNKPFKCHQCNYSTADKSNLRVHSYIHSADKPFKCNFCDFQSCTKFNLKLHMTNKHDNNYM